jgi:hypothetical protein
MGDTIIPSVVEPPKFITVKHVGSIFEKLGYDPVAGQKAFTILYDALKRIKTENQEEMEEENNYLLNKVDEMGEGYEDEEEEEDALKQESFRQPNNTTTAENAHSPKALLQVASINERKSTSTSTNSNNNESSNNNGPPSIDTKPLNEDQQQQVTRKFSPTATSNSGKAEARPTSEKISSEINNNAKMDFKDFVRAVELDDILVQVSFNYCLFLFFYFCF